MILSVSSIAVHMITFKPSFLLFSGIEKKDEIYSLCQLENGCTSSSNNRVCAITAIGLEHEQNDSSNDSLDQSPQCLIAKLTIDTKTKQSPISPLPLEQHNSSLTTDFSNTSLSPIGDTENTGHSNKNVDHASRMLRPLQSALMANDFLINSVCLTPPESDTCSPSSSVFSTTGSPLSLSPCSSSASHDTTACHINVIDDDKILFESEMELTRLMTTKCENLIDESDSGQCPITLSPSTLNTGVEKDDDVYNNDDAVQNLDGEKVFSSQSPLSLPLPLPSPPAKVLSAKSETPKPSTINVFVPFTEDMNTSFLGFEDDSSELTSKLCFHKIITNYSHF